MANKTKTTTATNPDGTPKVRKTRAPRQLSDIEVEAKQYYEDVKSFAKLLPTLTALGKTGRTKLAEFIGVPTGPALKGAGTVRMVV